MVGRSVGRRVHLDDDDDARDDDDDDDDDDVRARDAPSPAAPRCPRSAPVSMSARARIGGGASARFLAPSARARGAALARSRGVTRDENADGSPAATEVRGDAIKIDVRARGVARRARGRAREDGRGWMWITKP